MVSDAVYYAALVLGAAGTFFGLVAAVGLVRLPDVYTRAHAASKSDTLGALLAIGAVVLAIQAETATVKAAFLLVFTFLTNPTAAHAVTRAAHDQDVEPWTVDGPESGGDLTPSDGDGVPDGGTQTDERTAGPEAGDAGPEGGA